MEARGEAIEGRGVSNRKDRRQGKKKDLPTKKQKRERRD